MSTSFPGLSLLNWVEIQKGNSRNEVGRMRYIIPEGGGGTPSCGLHAMMCRWTYRVWFLASLAPLNGSVPEQVCPKQGPNIEDDALPKGSYFRSFFFCSKQKQGLLYRNLSNCEISPKTDCANAVATGSNPVKAPKYFFFSG